MKEKKAVSPVVATVLLIMIVIILAIIILLWSSSFFKEAVTKTIGTTEKKADDWCREIQIEPIIGSQIGFRNSGNIPIYAFKVKTKNSGDSEVNREEKKVNPQAVVMLDITSYDSYEEIKIIPIILGKSKGSNQEVECSESDEFILYSDNNAK